MNAPHPSAAAAERIVHALHGGEPVVRAVVVAVEPPSAPTVAVGAAALWWSDGRHGSLGLAALDAEAAARAAELLAGSGGAHTREVEVQGTRCTLYLEPHRPPPELLIVGAGHIARPLCRVGALLGFRVRVLDDRPEFATRERFPEAEEVRRTDFTDPFRHVPLGPLSHLVLVTRGHKYDYDALRDLLNRPVALPYIGMVGSRRRVRATLQQLAADHIPTERLASLYTPVGLDIGAETPEEIAIAIAAELVRVRRGGTGASLRDRERVVQRWIGR